MTNKLCKKCGSEDLLYKRRVCKKCHSVYTKEYYENNKDIIKDTSRLYSETHIEEQREYYRLYYQNKKEKSG